LQEIYQEVEKSGVLNFELAPLKMVEPLASAFAKQMTSYNIWGQSALLISQVRKWREYFVTLGMISKAACKNCDDILGELEAEKADIAAAEKAYNDYAEELRAKKELVAHAREEIKDRKKILPAAMFGGGPAASIVKRDFNQFRPDDPATPPSLLNRPQTATLASATPLYSDFLHSDNQSSDPSGDEDESEEESDHEEMKADPPLVAKGTGDATNQSDAGQHTQPPPANKEG
jgi:hypothetical protein